MRKLLALLIIAGLFSFGIGCSGSPSTTKPTTPKKEPDDKAKKPMDGDGKKKPSNGDKKGSISVEGAKADVTKGKEVKVTIKIKREDLKGAVTLTYDAPAGLTTEGGETIAADKDETSVTIKADKPLGIFNAQNVRLTDSQITTPEGVNRLAATNSQITITPR